jgi:Protein of unknown function (DUF2516)
VLSGINAMSPLDWFFSAVSIAAFVVEAWALIDAITRPAQGFAAIGKLSKPLWLLILGFATVAGLMYALYVRGLAATGILPVAAFVAAAVYLTDVRPKVKVFRKSGSKTSQGPYGPW